MRKPISLFAVAACVALLAVGPAAAANATTTKAAAPHYTLSVTGNGKHGSIFYVSEKISGSSAGTPKTGEYPNAKLPWKKSVSAKSDVLELIAARQGGTKITCVIRDAKHHVLNRSVAYGKNGVVSCIVTNQDLLGSISGLK